MKTNYILQIKYASALLCSILVLFSCSKSDNGGAPNTDDPDTNPPVNTTKVPEATFTKKTIQAYPTTFTGNPNDHISIINEHIYVMDHDSKKFRRYGLKTDKWEDLPSEASLYGGVRGYLTSHNGKSHKNVLFYLGGGSISPKLNIYYPSEYSDATLKNSWTSQSVGSDYVAGERGAASNGDYLYFVGNARDETSSSRIDRYVPAHDLWEKGMGYLPKQLDRYTQAISTGKKLFIAATDTERELVFFVYDLQTQKTESKPVPIENDESYATTENNTMVVYQDYLLYMLPNTTTPSTSVNLYVYDLKKEQWLENSVKIKTDLFSNARDNATLLLSSSGKIYAAGTKAGDFVLFEVDFKVTEQ